MNKTRLKQASALALSCVFFLSAYAAEKPQFSLKALGETRIDIPQGETHAVEYRLTNHSDQTRTLSMKPIRGIAQKGGKGQCGEFATLKSGESCLLTLKVNTNEFVNSDTIAPLVCEKGANWFDDEIIASSTCVQPKASEKLDVNFIPGNMASLSVKIERPKIGKSNLASEPGKTFCFHSMFACSMNLFAGGGSVVVTLTNTSSRAALGLTASVPWTDVSVSSTCPASLPPGASCSFTFNSRFAAKHPTAQVTISQVTSSGTTVPIYISTTVLGIGDGYLGGIIFTITAGSNSGQLAALGDTSASFQWSPALTLVGTDLQNGHQNSSNINTAFGTTSAAGLCWNNIAPGNGLWFLPSFNELEALISSALDVGTSRFNVSLTDWYWDSSEDTVDPTNEATQARFFETTPGTIDSQSAVKTTNARVRCIRNFP